MQAMYLKLKVSGKILLEIKYDYKFNLDLELPKVEAR